MIEAGADLTARVVEIIDETHVENVVANGTTSDAIYTVCVALKWLVGASVLGRDTVSGPLPSRRDTVISSRLQIRSRYSG